MATVGEIDRQWMALALEIAPRGEGAVEPNPAVGCVIARHGQLISQGWHERFGGPHAEIVALEAAGDHARDATLYVTLEPCCHHGKTPPCTQAILQAGIARVVVAVGDPHPQVAGRGIEQLLQAGVLCEVGLMEKAGRQLIAPFTRLITTGRPWVIAKWAMTVDGKLATATGDSQWISSPASRQVVHRLRGRVDAILVGSGTAARDNPKLTARPDDPADVRRQAVRIVVDGRARLALDSHLVATAGEVPVLLATSEAAPAETCQRLADRGVEVVRLPGPSHAERIDALLAELGARQMTRVLVEGGGQLLGSFFDLRALDEVHTFIAPRLAGGSRALTPLAGKGVAGIADALRLANVQVRDSGGDIYIHGLVDRSTD